MAKLKVKDNRKLRKINGIRKKENRSKWKKIKMSRLNLFRSKSKKDVIMYKFYSKSKSYAANFSKVKFKHVNFKGAIMTKCSFKSCEFIGVEFWGTNLRSSNFTNATFKYCIFVGTLLEKANFKRAVFINCVFVNMNFGDIKNIKVGLQNQVLKRYPDFIISDRLKQTLMNIRDNEWISKYKILHLNTSKFNKLNIYLLLQKYEEEKLIKILNYVKDRINKDMPTISCLFNYILKEKNIYDIV